MTGGFWETKVVEYTRPSGILNSKVLSVSEQTNVERKSNQLYTDFFVNEQVLTVHTGSKIL